MLRGKDIISIIKILKKENLVVVFKQAKQILKKDGIHELKIKIENRLPFEQEISLFDKKRGYILADESRYLYLKISSPVSCKISLYWYVGSQKYITKPFDIYMSPAIYVFDLAMIRASNQTGRTNYFWEGRVTNFGIKCNAGCIIKWSKFTNTKPTFEKERGPLIEIIDYPEIVHLEITRNCNLKCYMCRENRDEEVKEIGINDLDCQILNKMIPFMQNVNNIALFGWGESLCHPHFDRFIDAVSRIKERNHPKLLNKVKPHVSFTTNATLLTGDLINRIIKSGLDEIVASIDSPSEDNFNFIRKGADFKKVIANLRMLQECKAKYGVSHPKLTIDFVAMRRNIEELPEMIKFAVDLGIKRILVYYMTVVTKGLEQESLYYHRELTNHIFNQTEKLAQSNGINISLPPRFGTKVDPQGYCDDIQKIFYIKAEGTVISCCIATDFIIGNLYKESPEEIWQGEHRKKIIDNLRRGVLKGKCKNCYKFTGNDINLRETHIKV